MKLTCHLGACWAAFVVMPSAMAVLKLRRDLSIFHLLSSLVEAVSSGGLVLRLLQSTELLQWKADKFLHMKTAS